MDLFSQTRIKQKHDRLAAARLLFYALCLLCAIGYGFSFLSDTLLLPMTVGIASALLLVFVYYALLYPAKKFVKLLDQMRTGLTQEESYVFLSADGETERDGVPLHRLNVRYTSETETFERTLYATADAPIPPLTEGQPFIGKTYQNILVEIKEGSDCRTS